MEQKERSSCSIGISDAYFKEMPGLNAFRRKDGHSPSQWRATDPKLALLPQILFFQFPFLLPALPGELSYVYMEHKRLFTAIS